MNANDFRLKNKLVFVFFFSLLLSCNQAQKDGTTAGKTSTAKNDSSFNAGGQKESNTQTFSEMSDTLRFNLQMDSANQHVVVPVHVTSGSQLFAKLFSKDKNANIRISQLEFPDSTFDGPFGETLDHKIKDTGIYKIIVGENMMAGDRWNGNFTLTTWTK